MTILVKGKAFSVQFPQLLYQELKACSEDGLTGKQRDIKDIRNTISNKKIKKKNLGKKDSIES